MSERSRESAAGSSSRAAKPLEPAAPPFAYFCAAPLAACCATAAAFAAPLAAFDRSAEPRPQPTEATGADGGDGAERARRRARHVAEARAAAAAAAAAAEAAGGAHAAHAATAPSGAAELSAHPRGGLLAKPLLARDVLGLRLAREGLDAVRIGRCGHRDAGSFSHEPAVDRRSCRRLAARARGRFLASTTSVGSAQWRRLRTTAPPRPPTSRHQQRRRGTRTRSSRRSFSRSGSGWARAWSPSSRCSRRRARAGCAATVRGAREGAAAAAGGGEHVRRRVVDVRVADDAVRRGAAAEGARLELRRAYPGAFVAAVTAVSVLPALRARSRAPSCATAPSAPAARRPPLPRARDAVRAARARGAGKIGVEVEIGDGLRVTE